MQFPSPNGGFGVRILGTGSAVPEQRLTNQALSQTLDTSDEWITQRTGIQERRVSSQPGEGCTLLGTRAVGAALLNAGVPASELDLVILATSTAEMTCPPVACRVAHDSGAVHASAFDLVAACSGFVYALNTADSIIRMGRARTVAVVGSESMSSIVDYGDRTTAVLFGDAAAAVILRRDQDPRNGCLFQAMGADASNWASVYIPRRAEDLPPDDAASEVRLGCIRLQGQQVYRFAVNKLSEIIEEAFEKTGLGQDSMSQIICHQSNRRILDSVRERLGIDPGKLFINLERFGNTSAASVPMCLDELWRAGKLPAGQPFLLAAIGGGMTWASCVWNQ